MGGHREGVEDAFDRLRTVPRVLASRHKLIHAVICLPSAFRTAASAFLHDTPSGLPPLAIGRIYSDETLLVCIHLLRCCIVPN